MLLCYTIFEEGKSRKNKSEISQKPKCISIKLDLLIHGPSLAIGAGIASVSIIIAFLGFSMINDEPELVIEVVASEITLSPIHKAAQDKIRKGSGLALRFPTFKVLVWPFCTLTRAKTFRECRSRWPVLF